MAESKTPFATPSPPSRDRLSVCAATPPARRRRGRRRRQRSSAHFLALKSRFEPLPNGEGLTTDQFSTDSLLIRSIKDENKHDTAVESMSSPDGGTGDPIPARIRSLRATAARRVTVSCNAAPESKDLGVLTISLVDDGPPTRAPPPLPPIISKATPPPLPPPDPLSALPSGLPSRNASPPPLPPRETATEEKALLITRRSRTPPPLPPRSPAMSRAFGTKVTPPLPPRRNSAPLIHQTMGSTVDERHLMSSRRPGQRRASLPICTGKTNPLSRSQPQTHAFVTRAEAPTASPRASIPSATGSLRHPLSLWKKRRGVVANILERSRNLSPRALSKQRVFDTPHSDGTADSDMKHSKPMGATPAVKAPKKIKGIASLLGLHGGEEDESRLESQASRRRRVTIGAGGPFQCATDPSAAALPENNRSRSTSTPQSKRSTSPTLLEISSRRHSSPRRRIIHVRLTSEDARGAPLFRRSESKCNSGDFTETFKKLMADRGAAASASAQAKARWDAYKREQERRAREDSAERERQRAHAEAERRRRTALDQKRSEVRRYFRLNWKSVQNGGATTKGGTSDTGAPQRLAKAELIATQGVFTPICTAPADSVRGLFQNLVANTEAQLTAVAEMPARSDFSRGVQSVREHKRPKNRSGAQSAKTPPPYLVRERHGTRRSSLRGGETVMRDLTSLHSSSAGSGSGMGSGRIKAPPLSPSPTRTPTAHDGDDVWMSFLRYISRPHMARLRCLCPLPGCPVFTVRLYTAARILQEGLRGTLRARLFSTKILGQLFLTSAGLPPCARVDALATLGAFDGVDVISLAEAAVGSPGDARGLPASTCASVLTQIAVGHICCPRMTTEDHSTVGAEAAAELAAGNVCVPCVLPSLARAVAKGAVALVDGDADGAAATPYARSLTSMLIGDGDSGERLGVSLSRSAPMLHCSAKWRDAALDMLHSAWRVWRRQDSAAAATMKSVGKCAVDDGSKDAQSLSEGDGQLRCSQVEDLVFRANLHSARIRLCIDNSGSEDTKASQKTRSQPTTQLSSTTRQHHPRLRRRRASVPTARRRSTTHTRDTNTTTDTDSSESPPRARAAETTAVQPASSAWSRRKKAQGPIEIRPATCLLRGAVMLEAGYTAWAQLNTSRFVFSAVIKHYFTVMPTLLGADTPRVTQRVHAAHLGILLRLLRDGDLTDHDTTPKQQHGDAWGANLAVWIAHFLQCVLHGGGRGWTGVALQGPVAVHPQSAAVDAANLALCCDILTARGGRERGHAQVDTVFERGLSLVATLMSQLRNALETPAKLASQSIARVLRDTKSGVKALSFLRAQVAMAAASTGTGTGVGMTPLDMRVVEGQLRLELPVPSRLLWFCLTPSRLLCAARREAVLRGSGIRQSYCSDTIAITGVRVLEPEGGHGEEEAPSGTVFRVTLRGDKSLTLRANDEHTRANWVHFLSLATESARALSPAVSAWGGLQLTTASTTSSDVAPDDDEPVLFTALGDVRMRQLTHKRLTLETDDVHGNKISALRRAPSRAFSVNAATMSGRAPQIRRRGSASDATPSSRRGHRRRAVPFLWDRLVRLGSGRSMRSLHSQRKRCRLCGAVFGLLRRGVHCRVCLVLHCKACMRNPAGRRPGFRRVTKVSCATYYFFFRFVLSVSP